MFRNFWRMKIHFLNTKIAFVIRSNKVTKLNVIMHCLLPFCLFCLERSDVAVLSTPNATHKSIGNTVLALYRESWFLIRINSYISRLNILTRNRFIIPNKGAVQICFQNDLILPFNCISNKLQINNHKSRKWNKV